MNSLPDFLIDRYKEWRTETYNNQKSLLKKLNKEGQNPKFMIISCCDSRVLESNIFKIREGEFFIHKNIANIVPAYNPKKKEQVTLAAVEYAVKVLRVEHIIILGHSNCGGVNQAYKVFSSQNENKYDFIDNCIEDLKKPYLNVQDKLLDKKNLHLLEKESIKNSISNLLTFPIINKLSNNSKIFLHGLWYEIGEGELFYLDNNTQVFNKLIY